MKLLFKCLLTLLFYGFVQTLSAKTVEFEKLDSDNDLKVSFNELFQYWLQREEDAQKLEVEKFFQECDQNQDQKIHNSELELVPIEKITLKMRLDMTRGGCKNSAEIMEVVDSNKDGYLSKQEFISTLKNRKTLPKTLQAIHAKLNVSPDESNKNMFQQCDTDKDESLTLREAAAMRCGVYTERFDQMDRNKDFQVSFSEWMGDKDQQQHASKALDDGHFSTNEVGNIMDLYDLIPLCDKDINEKLDGDEIKDKSCRISVDLLQRVDANSDHAIDYPEIDRAKVRESFDLMDANRNGLLEKNELQPQIIRFL